MLHSSLKRYNSFLPMKVPAEEESLFALAPVESCNEEKNDGCLLESLSLREPSCRYGVRM